jgi:2-polyprenyl-3-methyl-5-hydroxy-6-metoxy-1,4-benzoquinol methylase
VKSNGFQTDFFDHFSKLHDLESRKIKADKIIDDLKLVREDLSSLDCLDIGCSSGLITSIVSPFFRRMVGIDFDPSGLTHIAPQQKLETSFIRGDALKLPFSSQSFDAIICAQVYEHVASEPALITEIERVIRPGGIVFFSGPNKLFPIEPHFFLPFLHWMPDKMARFYMRVTRKGNLYDIRPLTYWSLKKSLQHFDIYDMTIPFLRSMVKKNRSFGARLSQLILKSPKIIWAKFFLPIIPNFNWVLIKLEEGRKSTYHVVDRS